MHDWAKDKVDKIITDPNSQGKEYTLMREKLLYSMKGAFPYALDDGYNFVQKLKKEEPTMSGSRGRQTTLCSGYCAVGFQFKPVLTMAPTVPVPPPVLAPAAHAALLLTPTAAPAPASASASPPSAATASTSASSSPGTTTVD
jgi:hypothetical protein